MPTLLAGCATRSAPRLGDRRHHAAPSLMCRRCAGTSCRRLRSRRRAMSSSSSASPTAPTGIGEAATLGGPRWSEESVEAIKANIDAYLAPALLGPARGPLRAVAAARMDAGRETQQRRQSRDRDGAVRRRRQDPELPAAPCWAARCRDRFPVLWTLASGDPAQEIEEAEAQARPLACTTPSRSRSARRSPRPTWPACATSPARWRDAPI